MSELVARINGSPVTRYEFQTVLQEFALGKGGGDPAQRFSREELEALAFERLIARELIFLEALKAGVIAGEQEVVAECRRTIEGFRSEAVFLEALAKAGGDPGTFQRAIRKDLSVARMSEQYLATLPGPSDDEVEGYYRRHADQLRRSERYRLRQLLVPCDADDRNEGRRRIDELRARLGKETFVDLIRRYSECPSAMRDGEFDGVSAAQMAPELHAALQGLAPGEVSAPIETPAGFHLVELLAIIPAEVPPLEGCRDEIVACLVREQHGTALEAWVAQLRREARIENLLT